MTCPHEGAPIRGLSVVPAQIGPAAGVSAATSPTRTSEDPPILRFAATIRSAEASNAKLTQVVIKMTITEDSPVSSTHSAKIGLVRP